MILDKFFATNQVCQSCGLSRSTILRLEDRGLLKPAFIDPKTGVRRYDNNNVAQIMQIKRFLDMGLTYDDVALYYQSGGTSRELLTRIEEQYLRFKRAYEDIKLRVDKREHLSFEFVELPEYVCYAREFHGATVEDSYRAMYGLHHEAVEKGYRLSATEPLFLIHKRTEYLEGKFADTPGDFICCVPLEPKGAPAEAAVYPSCRGFSCLGYGDYAQRNALYNEFGRELQKRGLKPAGHLRVLGLVAPYVGRDISPTNFVTRIVVPIEG